MLGDIERLSGLGQPLRARVLLTLGPGEAVDPGCVRVAGKRPEDIAEFPVLPGMRARVRSQGGRPYLLVESDESVMEPILQLSVEVRCDATGTVTRDYVLLLELREGRSDPPPAEPVQLEPPRGARPEAARPPAAATPQSTAAASAGAEAAPPEPRRKRRAPAATPPETAASASAAPAPQAKRARKRAAPDVLRLAPGLEAPPAVEAAGGDRGLRLSYELGPREGRQVTEADRERLRMEFAERNGEGGNIEKLLALRKENEALASRATALETDRKRSDARSDRAVESARLAWLLFAVLAAALLVASLWLWLRGTRRVPFDIASRDLYDTRPAAPQPVAAPEAAPAPMPVPAVVPVQEMPPPRVDEDFTKTVRITRPFVVPPPAPAPAPEPVVVPAAEPEPAFDLPATPTRVELEPLPFVLDPPAEVAPPAIPVAETPAAAVDAPAEALTIDFDLDEPAPAPAEQPAPEPLAFEAILAASLEDPAPEAAQAIEPALPAEADLGAEALQARGRGYREAWMAGRFPEIAAGRVDLADAASVVAVAGRIYLEDGDASRAMALLQLACALHTASAAPWLGLLELCWREGLADAYAELALRFKAAHPGAAEWPLVAKLGHGLDPANPAFPAAESRAAADGGPDWLGAPAAVAGSALAAELRMQVIGTA